jgi:hypothetical protein
MSDLFQSSVSKIDSFYKERQYQLGWRFLNCSKSVLSANPEIAFITLNPGGKEIPNDHPWASCENGSSYLTEVWGNSPAGKSNLQVQIQLMFSNLAEKLNFSGTANQLINESLSGYFVPFRSPRLADLEHKREAFMFGNDLWGKILASINPSLFICIDRESFKRLQPLIEHTYNLQITSSEKYETGWGNYSADIVRFGDNSEKKLLRLPHLSTFKLFTSKKCSENIDELFFKFCEKL